MFLIMTTYWATTSSGIFQDKASSRESVECANAVRWSECSAVFTADMCVWITSHTAVRIRGGASAAGGAINAAVKEGIV